MAYDITIRVNVKVRCLPHVLLEAVNEVVLVDRCAVVTGVFVKEFSVLYFTGCEVNEVSGINRGNPHLCIVFLPACATVVNEVIDSVIGHTSTIA